MSNISKAMSIAAAGAAGGDVINIEDVFATQMMPARLKAENVRLEFERNCK